MKLCISRRCGPATPISTVRSRFVNFLRAVADLEFDVMLESKAKDLALIRARGATCCASPRRSLRALDCLPPKRRRLSAKKKDVLELDTSPACILLLVAASRVLIRFADEDIFIGSLLLLLATYMALAQLPDVDQDLLAQIRQIKAIDNHAHVVKMTPPGTCG